MNGPRLSLWHLKQTKFWSAVVAQLTVFQCAVRIVAIGALDQPFVDAMMERLLEVGSLFRVAGEAQRRLLLTSKYSSFE